MDSKMGWINKPPHGWRVDRLKSAARITLGKMLSPEASNRNTIELAYVRAANLSEEVSVVDADLKRMWFSPGEAKTLALRSGDILIAEGGMIGQPSFVDCVNDGESICFQNSINRLRSTYNQRFMFFWMRFLFDSGYHQSTVNAVSIAHLTKEKLGEVYVLVPPAQTQHRIAAWLDLQTSRIDKRIELLGNKRELLLELRRNVVSEVIATGLARQDKEATGLPNLPQHPNGWKTTQAKRLLRFITSGSRGWAEYYTDDGDLFLRIGNLTRETIELDMSNVQYVSLPAKATEGKRTRIREGDMLVSITADLGSIAVAPKLDKAAYVNQHIALCRPKERVHPRWLGYAMLSRQSKQQMINSGYGGTKVQLSLDDVRNVWLAVPPFDEQSEIATYLDKRLDKIARQIALIDRLQALLREQRKAIIHEAVTGKIDLSNYEPPAQAD